MKKIFTIACLAILPAISQAQITINQTTFSFWTPGVDTVKKTMGVAPAQATGGSQQWDFSGTTYTADTNIIHVGTNSSFYTSIRYAVGDFVLDAQATSAIDANSYKWTGEEVVTRQAYPLIGPGSMPTDSVVFPVQTGTYTSARPVINFPATQNSVWTSSYVVPTQFELTYQAGFYNQAPGYRNSTVTNHDTVTGWGTMRVVRYDGTISDWMDVIQVRSHRRQVDTFYASGVLIPDLLLAFVGTKQQDTTDAYHIRYYRIGEVTPLAELRYTDETYNMLDQTLVHTDNLPAGATAVSTVASKEGVRIYPNPVTNRELTIAVNDAKGNWNYQLINTVGQTVSGNNLSVSNGTAKLHLGKALPVGTYYLQLVQDGRIVTTQPVVVE